MADGLCGNDVERTCDTDADCTKMKVRIARSEDVCFERGGEVGGEGSVCTACLPAAP
jgi:hypothetical protein